MAEAHTIKRLGRDPMRIVRATVRKTFTVQHKGWNYVVDCCLHSDGAVPGLVKEGSFKVTNELGEELTTCALRCAGTAERERVRKLRRLARKLIRHSIEHFKAPDAKLAEGFTEYQASAD